MSYELTGKIKLIQETQTYGSGFQKREMVVTVEEGKYTQDINLEFVQDKIALLDTVDVGQEVTVAFNIRGREYNGRYFNNLQGWKLQAFGPAAGSDDQPPPPTDVPADFEEYEDSIPF